MTKFLPQDTYVNGGLPTSFPAELGPGRSPSTGGGIFPGATNLPISVSWPAKSFVPVRSYDPSQLLGEKSSWRWVSWFLLICFSLCFSNTLRPEAKRFRGEDTARPTAAAAPVAAPEVVAVEEESLRRKAAADLYAQA